MKRNVIPVYQTESNQTYISHWHTQQDQTPNVITTKIGTFVCPPHISETVAVTITGLHNKHWPAGPPAICSRRASSGQ